MKFFEFLKNLFLVLIILQFAPAIFSSLKKTYQGIFEPKTQVGVVPIRGMIMDSARSNAQLASYFRNKSIKAILIKMECPGGAAGTANAIHDQIKQLKKEYPKPVVCLVENICASGGYYIASSCDSIIAPAQALIGSIGATFPYAFQVNALLEKWNIGYVPLKAGDYKNAANPFVAMTPDEKALLQGVLDDSYRQFAADIAADRRLSLSDLTTWGNGKIFTGSQAKALGLVDTLGNIATAERIIKEKALIEGDIEWVKPPVRSPLAYLFGAQDAEDEQELSEEMATWVGHSLTSRILHGASFIG